MPIGSPKRQLTAQLIGVKQCQKKFLLGQGQILQALFVELLALFVEKFVVWLGCDHVLKIRKKGF
jgi:hypothetical protein